MLGDFVALRCNAFFYFFREMSYETIGFETTFGILITTCQFVRFMTPQREPGDKEGLLISLCLRYFGSMLVDMGRYFVKMNRIPTI